ncbi:MAG: Cell division protein sepF [Pseudonocardia sp.]|jgi:cell division inhibitor SepF|nr:Cell division protein sepF [Pseudonocardia sp.]
MGAMYRLKAYFGMVPVEEMPDFADDQPLERYAGPRGREYRDDRWSDGEYADREYPPAPRDVHPNDERGSNRYGDVERRPAREPSRPSGFERPREVVARLDREPGRGPVGAGAGIGAGAVRGALAVDADSLRDPGPRELSRRDAPLREPVLREPARLPERPAPIMGPRLGGAAALSKITTLQPASYNEARTIGERYRDGVPVIMNLTELDDAAAKRLVDFAAGLAFALRGSIDKVTNRVFLLTPADIEVSADDARRLAERGLFHRS